MITVIGVSFRSSGKVYYFSPGTYQVERGNHVIVETARGVEIGKVAMAPREMEDDKVVQPLKSIIRVATPEDMEKSAMTRAKEKTAYQICKEKIRKHGLEMKLIDAEYTFDESKLLFYFTADGRVDFRELVKDLASEYRTRIELRQVGVRDETKILGGIGICGRVLCCHSYLADFVPVSIKMAKEQNLSLNPSKISGSCGRLMCCLKYEQDAYEELNRHLPGVGDVIITTDNLKGRVEAVDVLRQKVRIIVERGDDKEMYEIDASRISGRVSKGKKKKTGKYIPDATPEELQALEDMEKSAAKPSRSERGEKKEAQSENGSRTERSEKSDKGDRGERQGRSERRNRSERQGRKGGSRSESGETDGLSRSEIGSRTERGEKSDKGDRGERQGRSERRNRSERQGRTGGSPLESGGPDGSTLRSGPLIADVPRTSFASRSEIGSRSWKEESRRKDGKEHRNHRDNRGGRDRRNKKNSDQQSS